MPSFPKRGEGPELGLQRLAGCSWYLNLSRSLSQVYIQTRTSYVGHGLNPLSQIHGPRLHHHVSMVAYESRSEGQGQLRWRRFYFLLLALKDSAHTKDLLTSVTDVGSMGTVE